MLSLTGQVIESRKQESTITQLKSTDEETLVFGMYSVRVDWIGFVENDKN